MNSIDWGPLKPYKRFEKLGEGKGRTLLAIGRYQEMKGYATYQDIARATSLSLSRAKTLTRELEKLGLIKKSMEGRMTIIKLSEKGQEYYRELIEFLDKDRRLDIPSLIRKYNEYVYRDSSHIKMVGRIPIYIDSAVAALKIPELISSVVQEVGLTPFFGAALNLYADVEKAVNRKRTRFTWKQLFRSSLNVPLRIARVTDVALPPNVFGKVMTIKELKGYLSFTAVWPSQVREQGIFNYLDEAQGYGYIKIEVSIIHPLLGSGIRVIDNIAESGFDTLSKTPSRIWIPYLALYYDASMNMLTVEDILSANKGKVLKLVMEHVGYHRYIKWMEHLLGLKNHSFKMPTLKDLGIADEVKIGDESIILTASVARRVLKKTFQKDASINTIVKYAKKLIENIINEAGTYGIVARYILERGYIDGDYISDIRHYLKKNFDIEHDTTTITRIITDLEAIGIAQPTSMGLYSSWTLTPIIEDEDTSYRQVLMWIDKELKTAQGETSGIFREGLKKLVEKGIANIYDFTNDVRKVLPLFKKFYTLESMGILKIDEDSGIMKIHDTKAKRILTIALIEDLIGHELKGLRINRGDKNVLISSLVDTLRRV